MTEPTPIPTQATFDSPTLGPIADFSLPDIPLKVDGNIFTAPGAIAPITLQKIAATHARLTYETASLVQADGETREQLEMRRIARTVEILAELFALLLPGEDGEMFGLRLTTAGLPGDPRPIDLKQQALPVLFYLMERYGLRPTPQSSAWPSVSETGDLTAGAPAAALTGAQSPAPINS